MLPSDLPNLLVDKRPIRQVLINLLSNAVKSTREEGRITLDAKVPEKEGSQSIEHAAQDYLQISIQDTGIGIAPEHVPKLFKHFRNLSNLETVPIIALTAVAMEGNRERCLGAGANDYISKQVKLKELVSSIRNRLAIKV